MSRTGRSAALTAEQRQQPGPAAPRPPRRGRYRRRRWLAIGTLLVVLLAGAVVGGRALLLHAGMFRVAQIEVDAAAGLDQNEVRAASGVRLGVPLLTVDLSAVQRSVAGVAQVASVRASRSWPATLRLTVTPRTPIAVTQSANGLWLLDGSGTAYQAAPTPAPALPRLAADRVGPGDPATMAALAVLTSLPPPIREKLQVVEADGPADVTLRLAGDKRVRWGSPTDSARKAAVLQVLLSQSGSGYDVSAPDLPTVRR